MCGIAGVWNPALSESEARTRIRHMCSTIIHRGPDDEGHFVRSPIALGVRRLSIIDVSGGHQPIGNEDGSIQLVYNGEIYNYRLLRRQLIEQGHRFTTQSDSEVVIHAYEQYGDDCFNQLWGMFAIAIWDERRHRLVLARDRMGKKPLFYAHRGETLHFGSEMKAILSNRTIPREVDLEALDQYFTYGYVPGPRTIFQGIKKLPPGSILEFDGADLRIRPYWSLEISPTGPITEDEAVERVRELLRDSVRIRLMSEVPLGAFLSGGVDSSAVVALMAEMSSRPVKTFSIGFAEPGFSELSYAREVSATFDTDHHEAMVYPNIIQVLPELVRAYDEPFADESMLPTFAVARLARQHVTVALSGDGGDEAFGGYPRYVSALHDLSYSPFPPSLRALANTLGSLMPEGMRGKTRLHAQQLSPEQRFIEISAIYPRRIKRHLYTPAFNAALGGADGYSVQMDHFDAMPSANFLTRMQYVDLKTYLVDDILAKVDRASMWASLEVRAPFLDHRLVELALSLPASFHMRETGKHVLKRALEGMLPANILKRAKKGFGVPFIYWFRGELEPYVREVLLDGRLAARGYVSPAYVSRLLHLHASGNANNSRRLWTLLCFELWCREYLDTSSRPHELAAVPPATVP